MGFLSLSGDRIAASKSRLVNAGSAFTPRSITGLALWLDASSPETLFTTDAGAVTAVSSPTDIAGCVGWWDASDAASITQSGGLVSQWNDKSGNNRHATASGSLRPTSGGSQNGRTVMQFTGTQALTITGNFLQSENVTLFAVAMKNTDHYGGIITSAPTNPEDSPLLGFYSTTIALVNRRQVVQQALANGVYGIVCGQANGTSQQGWFNGVKGTDSVASAAPNTAGTITKIGAFRTSGAADLNGNIAEIVCYSGNLSVAQRASVEAYLAAKWGISGVHAPATATSDPVGAWLDKSGNARHATQSTSANRPLVGAAVANGRRGVNFGTAGNSQRLGWLPSSGTQDWREVIAVAVYDRSASTFADVETLFSGHNTNSGTSLGIGLSGEPANMFTSQYGTFLPETNINALGHVATSLVRPFPTISSPFVVIARATSAVTPVAVAGYVVGNDRQFSPNRNWRGRISEVIAFERALTASERNKIVRYLASKYGITLAPQVSNADAQDWINRVYANGGTVVSSSTAAAVSTFCDAIDAAGIRDRFYRLNLFCGGTSGTTAGLAACLVPLYRGPSLGGTQYGGATDTNVGPFVVGDYSESNGLDGDGVGKYLNTGLSPDNMGVPQTVHLSAFKGGGSWNTSREFMGTRDADDFYTLQCRYPATAVPSLSLLLGGSVSSINETPVSTVDSFLIATRTSSSEMHLWQDGTKIATGGTAATTPGANSNPYMVFTRNVSGTAGASPWEHALRSYSIGLGLNDEQAVAYNAAMQTFQTALGRGIPRNNPAFAAVTNDDAKLWIDSVYSQGGSVTPSTAIAVNAFCNAIDNASLRDRFYRLSLFAGTGLTASLVPLYRTPNKAITNLFHYGTDLSNSMWLGGGNGPMTRVLTSEVGPLGFGYATKLTTPTAPYETRQMYQLPRVQGRQVTLSVWLKTNTGTKNIQWMINGEYLDTFAVTSTWTRYTKTYTSTNLASDGRTALVSVSELNDAGHILAWGMQVEYGAVATGYNQPVYGNAIDVNANNNFATTDYLETGAGGGLLGNGTSKYLNTGLTVSDIGTAASGHMSVYHGQSSGATTNRYYMGANDATVNNRFYFGTDAFVSASVVAQYGATQSANQTLASQGHGTAGHRILSRETDSLLTHYHNGSVVGTNTTGITPAVSTAAFAVFAVNRNGTVDRWHNSWIAAYSIGLGLNSTQAANYRTIMQTFQTALGRNV